MANEVRRGKSCAGNLYVRFLFCGIFAAMHFAAIGSWYHEPSVKATVRTGVEKSRAYFMNMSADGEWLLLNLHCDQAGYGLQLYPVDQLLAADGGVDADDVGVKTFSGGRQAAVSDGGRDRRASETGAAGVLRLAVRGASRGRCRPGLARPPSRLRLASSFRALRLGGRDK